MSHFTDKCSKYTDTYIPSQLILVSEDCLAQYWEVFGHISFYRRVDVDKLLGMD
jgi:hypothetical protein